jgi:hypothetical protein
MRQYGQCVLDYTESGPVAGFYITAIKSIKVGLVSRSHVAQDIFPTCSNTACLVLKQFKFFSFSW